MPQNMSGFGYLHDSLSQQGIGSNSRILVPQVDRADAGGVAVKHGPYAAEREYELDVSVAAGLCALGELLLEAPRLLTLSA